MNTKACKKCGWVYPITQPGMVCQICGEPFDIVVCRVCGRVVSGDKRVPGRNLCKACHSAEESRHMKVYLPKHYAKLEAAYDEWMEKIKRVPASYHKLTEKEWLESCSYFDGCARCHSKDIDSRGFFIGFEIGGRYCDWNIIPLCEKCSKIWALNKNPFRMAEIRDRAEKADFEYRENLYRIVEYLGGKLNDAMGAERRI